MPDLDSADPVPPEDADFEAVRPAYQAELAAGIGRFFEPPRRTCPWCGSGRLRERVTVPDLVQHKPGRFRLDECRTCGHVFQNPRLTPAGLDFYYRDFYSGLGASAMDGLFAMQTPFYRARASMVAPFLTPKTWLDVGTGYGHFCAEARTVWPDASFDGLDQSVGVLVAQRRGWIDQGYRGSLTDLAGDLAGRYDVVSMHHYLEHVRDPRAELDVAAAVVGPGSYLLVEVPDPAAVMARLLGRWWGPWVQPQHLHLFPLANLLAALTERGFAPVAVHRGEAHMPIELTSAVTAMCTYLAPEPRLPWRPRPTRAAKLRYRAVWKAAPPLIRAAYKADTALDPLLRRAGPNVYRVLARRGG